MKKIKLHPLRKIDQQGLTSVAALARTIRDKEATISDLEQRLKDEKKELLKLTDEEMPAMLAEMRHVPLRT